MKSKRFVRRTAVAVVVLLGLAVVGDVVALQVVEGRASRALAATLAAESAQVKLGSFPFLPGLLTGRFSRVEVDASGSSGAGLRVNSLHATLNHLTFKRSDILRLIRSRYSTQAKVSAAEPFGKIEISEFDLSDFIRSRVESVNRVSVEQSGIEIRFDAPPVAEDGQTPPQPVARFLPRVEEGRVVLKLLGVEGLPKPAIQAALRIERIIDLPKIPAGLKADVRLGTDGFQVEVNGEKVALTIGEGGIR